MRDAQAVLGLSHLELAVALELDVAHAEVGATEVDSEVRALLLTGRPAKDESREHGLCRRARVVREGQRMSRGCGRERSGAQDDEGGRTTSLPFSASPRSRTSMNESTILQSEGETEGR